MLIFSRAKPLQSEDIRETLEEAAEILQSRETFTDGNDVNASEQQSLPGETSKEDHLAGQDEVHVNDQFSEGVENYEEYDEEYDGSYSEEYDYNYDGEGDGALLNDDAPQPLLPQYTGNCIF